MKKSFRNQQKRNWGLTGIFLVTLIIGNLSVWNHYIRQKRNINSIIEANQALTWQAEVAIRQSETLYSICQKYRDCAQENVPPLNFTVSDLPIAEQSPTPKLALWLICQVVLIPLWLSIVFSYYKLKQRHESLKFDYQNLLESQRHHQKQTTNSRLS